MNAPGTMGRFLGKYRATVLDNNDPDQRGRLQLEIPDVLGSVASTWAEACVPLAGPTGAAMGIYFVPPIGAGVWAEFEQGDLNYPIWVGCRWGGQADVPSVALEGDPSSPNLVLQSQRQHSLTISDSPPPQTTGGIILKSAGGVSIVVNDSGIYLSNGQASITLIGQAVDVNNGGLSVDSAG